jgi:hypothetical protein
MAVVARAPTPVAGDPRRATWTAVRSLRPDAAVAAAVRRRRSFRLTDRATVALAVVAGAAVAAALAVELGRVWRRGSAPLPHETDELLPAAAEAVSETAAAVVVGYREGSTRENAVFNMLISFVGSFVVVRGIAYRLRTRRRVGPFRNLTLGKRHIHHFVPGILLTTAAGAVAIGSRNEDLEPLLAIPFGVGLGMTLDESALLLELEDVYWSPEGVVGVQITLAAAALLSALVIGLRFVRRGERLVLSESGLHLVPEGMRRVSAR